MKNQMMAVIGLATLSACGVNDAEFREQYTEAICSLTMECQSDDDLFQFDSQGECEVLVTLFMADTYGDDCEYDKKLGKECLTDMEDATCDSMVNPAACEEVFSGECGYWGGSYEYSDTGE